MKRILFLALAALIGLGSSSFAQDTSKVRVGNKKYTVVVDDDKEITILSDEDFEDNVIVTHKIHKKKKPRKMDGTWDGLEIGFANFVNSDYEFALPAEAAFIEPDMLKSLTFNFNFAEKSLGIIRNYFGIVTGMGLEYTRYMLTNDVKLAEVGGQMTGTPVDFDLNKNRFSMTYLNVPLMLEFQIPVYGEHNRIKLSAGVVGGVKLGSRQVQKYTVDGEKQKIKSKDSYNLRNFKYGFTARVGYGDITLFANYYPQTLFTDGMGPDIYPVTVGLHLGSN